MASLGPVPLKNLIKYNIIFQDKNRKPFTAHPSLVSQISPQWRPILAFIRSTVADSSIYWKRFFNVFMSPSSLESASSYAHRATSLSTLNPVPKFPFAGTSTKGIFRLLVPDATCWPHWFIYRMGSLRSVQQGSPGTHRDWTLQVRKCLFTPGVQL